MDVATGKVPFHRSDCISHYKEVKRAHSLLIYYQIQVIIRHLLASMLVSYPDFTSRGTRTDRQGNCGYEISEEPQAVYSTRAQQWLLLSNMLIIALDLSRRNFGRWAFMISCLDSQWRLQKH